ncbi:23946_t:CDS:2, partial [Racocetra persica]
MTSIHITPGKLVATGTIEPELHYGPYMRDWWVFSKDNQEHISYSIPIRNGKSSGVVSSSSMAITSVYQAIFGTKTKFASLSYLDLEQPETFQKLLENVIFCPFIIKIENLSIYVGSLGKITCSNSNIVGHNYMASLFNKYKAKQSVFFQTVNDDNSYSIIIYQDSQIIAEYKDSSPNAVWIQTGVLKSFPDDTLFAINHPTTLQQLDQIYKAKFNHQTLIPNESVGKSAKEWHEIFQSWNQQKSNIIELYTHLSKIYGPNHEFRERELRAWCAIFHATGCTNITLYDKEISK